jgi:hypothetical protein
LDGATAKLIVPADALPTGTIISVFPVVEAAGLSLDLLGNQQYVVAFAVSWRGTNGNPFVAREKITLAISDREIRAGDVVDELTTSGLKEIEVSEKNSTVPVTFRQARTFVVAGAPAVKIVSTDIVVEATGVPVRIMCEGPIACAGTVSLSVAGSSTGSKTALVVVAQASFSLGGGATGSVLLLATAEGKSRLASLKTPRAMTVTVSETGAPSVSKTVEVGPSAPAHPH